MFPKDPERLVGPVPLAPHDKAVPMRECSVQSGARMCPSNSHWPNILEAGRVWGRVGDDVLIQASVEPGPSEGGLWIDCTSAPESC